MRIREHKRNNSPLSLSIILFCLLTTCLHAGGQDWSIESPSGIRPLSEGWIQVNYERATKAGADLCATPPILLPDGLTRIKLWYMNMEGNANLTFLIQDGVGKVHAVPLARDSGPQSWALKWDVKNRSKWAQWTQAESIWLRKPEQIGERLCPEDSKSAQKKLWPKPWVLTGIRLQTDTSAWGLSKKQREMAGEGKGAIVLGGIQFDQVSSFEASAYSVIADRLRWARNEPMKLFLDDFVTLEGKPKSAHKGSVRYEVKVRAGYQGPVVWQTSGEGEVDIAQPMELIRQAIDLPALRPGKYFLQLSAWDANGSFIEPRLWQWFVAQGPSQKEMPAIPEPLCWSTGQANHVFPPETRQASLAITDLLSAQTKGIRVRIVDWRGEEVFSRQYPAAPEQNITLPVQAGYDYFATAHALDAGGNVLDVALLHFGVANAPELEPSTRSMPNIDQLLKGTNEPHVEYWTRSQSSEEYPWINTADLADMKLWSDQIKSYGWSVLAVRTIWPDLEMLPGVTRWKLIDDIMDILHANGQKAMLGISIWGDRGEAVWMDWIPARDQHGDFQMRMNLASAYDLGSQTGKTQFWKNLASHYRNSPDMVGYHILGEGFSGTVRPEATRLDYAQPTQQAFGEWLLGQGLAPRKLPPLLTIPMVKMTDLGPDFSEDWRCLVEFYSESNALAVKKYLQAIRSVDKQRPVIVDRKPFPWGVEKVVPVLAADGNSALKNEGSPRFGDVALRSMSMQAGVPYLGELHRHIPTSRSLADVIYFWESLWADHALWIQRWRGYQMHDWEKEKGTLREDVPAVLDFMKETQPNWNAYMKLPCERPKVLVFGSRATELLGGQRRGFFDDIAGLDTYTALFRIHQVPVYMANEYTDWVDLDLFSLVFACGEVLTSHAAERLMAYAQRGGKLILVGEVGKHVVPDREDSTGFLDRMAKLENVRKVPDPTRLPLEYKLEEWNVPVAFDPQAIDGILAWSGVARPAAVASEFKPGFEVAVRRSADGNRIFVGVMRGWYGWYRDGLEKQEELENRFGLATGTASVTGLKDGTWSLRQFHRTEVKLGDIAAKNGEVRFPIEASEAGQVHLFELVRKE